MRAEAHVAAGEPERAVEALDGVDRWTSLRDEGLRWRARASAAAGDLDAMRETLVLVRARAAGRPRPLARAWILAAELEAQVAPMQAAIDADTDFAIDSPFPRPELAHGGVFAAENDPRTELR